MKACPTRAISKRDDGIVLVDEAKCCGTRACVAACPYGAMHFYEAETGETGRELTPYEKLFQHKYQKGTVQKCTFCSHRIDAGIYTPACVEACPTECRIFGDLDNPNSEVSRHIRRSNGVQPLAEAGTKPSVWYLK
ncbi:MAG: 4Fe-4S dicluster domain-containing protein [Anaerolineae bacterium]